MAAAAAGFAVRCDYPSLGTHEFVGFRATFPRALAFGEADAAFFRRGPLRMDHSVVVMSLRDFDVHAHRKDCRSPDCPTGATTAAWTAGSVPAQAQGVVWR
jgi:hypothetical protein